MTLIAGAVIVTGLLLTAAPLLLWILVLIIYVLVTLVSATWYLVAKGRDGSQLRWEPAGRDTPAASLDPVGFELLTDQPAGFCEPLLGRPAVWLHRDHTVTVLERDVVSEDVTVVGELILLSTFETGTILLMTRQIANMATPLRLFLQNADGPPASIHLAHMAAAGHLESTGMRIDVLTLELARAAWDRFQRRPLPFWPIVRFALGTRIGATLRTKRLRTPVWEQPNFEPKLRHLGFERAAR